MQIVCPQCGTSYEVADASMEGGRVVRCAACRHVWLAGPTLSEVVEQALVGASEATPQTTGEPTWPEPASPGELDSRAPAPTEVMASTVPDLPETGQPGPREVSPDPTEPIGEPRIIENAPPLLPESDEESVRATAADLDPNNKSSDSDDLAALRAARRKRAARRRRRMPRPSWATVILSLLVVIAAILAWRTEVVRAMPQTASLFAKIGLPVNLRGLAFKDLRIKKDSTESVTVLVVHGTIANVVRRRAEIPRLRFAVRDRSGNELHSWTALPAIGSLGPGEMLDFRTRLASPPEGTADVLVRFFNRRDR